MIKIVHALYRWINPSSWEHKSIKENYEWPKFSDVVISKNWFLNSNSFQNTVLQGNDSYSLKIFRWQNNNFWCKVEKKKFETANIWWKGDNCIMKSKGDNFKIHVCYVNRDIIYTHASKSVNKSIYLCIYPILPLINLILNQIIHLLDQSLHGNYSYINF